MKNKVSDKEILERKFASLKKIIKKLKKWFKKRSKEGIVVRESCS
jgi:hypothetical protein